MCVYIYQLHNDDHDFNIIVIITYILLMGKQTQEWLGTCQGLART